MTTNKMRALLVGGIGLVLAVLASPAHAGGCEDTVQVSANVTGTGKVIANGKAAWIHAVVTCPKGTSWSIDEAAGFNMADAAGEQVPGRAKVTGGKCLGKEQAVKLKFVPFPGFPPVAARCGDSYSLSFFFTASGGQQVDLNFAGGTEVTGPPVCLT